MMFLFAKVPVEPLTLYFAVKVLLPAVRPVTRYVALPCMSGAGEEAPPRMPATKD